jgi:MFS family permease
MLAALAAVLIGAIDLSIIATILPSIIADLNVNSADIDRYVWVVNAYLIAYIAAIPLAGRVSDLIGRRPVFLLCLAIFLAGSILCAEAETLQSLIVARAIQGFGGGAILPVTMALAGDVLGRKSHLAAVGTIASAETLGWILGPTYGAVIATLSGNDDSAWRWVFWLNVPIVAVIALLIAREVPGAHDGRTWNRLRQVDVPGLLLLTVVIVTLCVALTSSGELATSQQGLRALGGTPNPLADRIPVFLAIAAVGMMALIAWLRMAKHPILPVSLLRLKGYVAAVAGNFLIGTIMMIGVVNVPVVVALLVAGGDVSWTSALLLVPLTAGIAITAALGGHILQRISMTAIVTLGTVLTTAGLAAMYPLLDSMDIWRMIPGLAIAGIGLGLVIAPLGNAALDLASDADRGAAASTLIMARLLGMTLGVSALTALGVHRLQVLTDRLDPVFQEPGESTASFLARQQAFVLDHAIPLAVQVMQETFVAAALIALIALPPMLVMARSGSPERGDVGGE